MDVVGFVSNQSEANIQQFLLLMKSNLHTNEIRYMQMFKSHQHQLLLFYKFWSLKEAYLKAIGIGIGSHDYPLNSLDFSSILFKNESCSIHKGYWNNLPIGEMVSFSLSPSKFLSIAWVHPIEPISRSVLDIASIEFNHDVIYSCANGDCKICISEKECNSVIISFVCFVLASFVYL